MITYKCDLCKKYIDDIGGRLFFKQQDTDFDYPHLCEKCTKKLKRLLNDKIYWTTTNAAS